MTEKEKGILFDSLSELFNIQIKICDGLRLLDSYERDRYYKISSKLWETANNCLCDPE